MINIKFLACCWISIFLISSCTHSKIEFKSDYFTVSIDSRGSIIGLSGTRNYLSKTQEAPLLSLKSGDQIVAPDRVAWHEDRNLMILRYGSPDRFAEVIIHAKNTHITFELAHLEGFEAVEWVIWGPYPTTIGNIVGETVGVVRNDEFAIGIQSLNVKTLGGYPTNEDDSEPSFNIFATSSYVDVQDTIEVLYRGQTARHTEFGSVLQAYCRNRDRERIIPSWNHEYYTAPAYDDGGVIGSKIALFGCSKDQVLEILGAIELEEGLPHPEIDGEWNKTARHATAAYLIMGFGEENLDACLKVTKEAGLKYLYHGGPFENWGHFKLNPTQFPDNWESMKRCVQLAESKGIHLGVHTLSNFITTNDPYVTPIPDPRLAKVGYSQISEHISDDQKDIPIEDPMFFNQMKNNNLHAAVIGNELIRYTSVSDSQPWTLINCERGAFGTSPARHEAGSTIGKLMDHGYKTFLTNTELSKEMALTIADLFNQTGLQQISFDGLEGNWSTGMGQYGQQLFVKHWYDNLTPGLKGQVITDASRPGHFFWHIYTRMNWGEPWYAGFRESQTKYRLLNQDYFNRNLMPAMLGWFQMRPNTSIEDIEWLLARAAGFDAGFALVTSLATIRANGHSKQILAAVNRWETARMEGIFPDEIKKELQDISTEFHIETAGEKMQLVPINTSLGNVHEKKTRQPGEPTHTVFSFDNPNNQQILQFSIQLITDNPQMRASKISLELNNTQTLRLETTLLQNQIIKNDGSEISVLYDESWHEITEISNQPLLLNSGVNQILVNAEFEGAGHAELKLEFRSVGDPLQLK